MIFSQLWTEKYILIKTYLFRATFLYKLKLLISLNCLDPSKIANVPLAKVIIIYLLSENNIGGNGTQLLAEVCMKLQNVVMVAGTSVLSGCLSQYFPKYTEKCPDLCNTFLPADHKLAVKISEN